MSFHCKRCIFSVIYKQTNKMHLSDYVGYLYTIRYYIYLYIIDLINARMMEHITKIYNFIYILHSTDISVVELKTLKQDKINDTQPRNTCFAYFTTKLRLRGLAG